MIFNDHFGPKNQKLPVEKNLVFFQELKQRIHHRLIERIDISKLDYLGSGDLTREIGSIIEGLIANEGVPLNQTEKEKLLVDIQHETFGLGPLEPLLSDPSISDILVNNCSNVYIERKGKLQKTDIIFRDNNHLMQIIERIVSRVGRRIDESSPYVDARLSDGSRVNAIIPPLAIDGPVLSIRRFGVDPLKMNDLMALGTVDERMAVVLQNCVKTRLNILISGGTGTGKTTMLNVLSEYIPEVERIVTIEDSAELQMKQDHVVRLETRPPNIEGRGEVTQRDLVRNALRMRPDRIVLGEVRSSEALDMLQAMNTGHDGSISTIHANSPRDALSRLGTMVMMAGMDLPDKAIREQISSAINLLIQLVRFPDGSRKVIKIAEITGMEGNTVVMQDIFVFDQQGVDADGKVIGTFKATGIRPHFMQRFKLSGINLPNEIFE
ncbi:CpaF family protein [Oryzomonas sagensis]|uniref:CpaF family protein n=1 Tax=Oryzomonas sagensis TaxID=2603857 RepID=A0ABQ6TKE9_9BACT|nr:CpaF family protein [Oryzomonas sagensis]KAB0668559.1 CpaF family protein [Oryzomonas sagensis]